MSLSTIDVIPPFDPTAFTTITGAQLYQLVGGIVPNSDIGFIIASVDIATVPQVPPANVTTKWQNYMWLRVSASFVTAYVWNPNGATDATFLNWVTLTSASIAPGTIQGFQIASATITSANILSISSNLITGSVVAAWLAQLNIGQTAYVTNGLLQTNSPLFGDLDGINSTLGNPIIGPGAITSGKIAAQSVTGSGTALAGQVVDNSITKLQLLSNGQAAATPLVNAAVDINNNVIVPTTSVIGIPGTTTQNVSAGDVLVVNNSKNGYVTNNRAILNLADPSTISNLRVLGVASGATIYSYSNPQGSNLYGRFLQSIETFDKTPGSSTSANSVTTAPTTSTCTLVASLTATITPVSASSIIDIELCMYLGNSSTNNMVLAALFQDANTNGLAAATSSNTSSTFVQPVILRYTLTGATAGTPTTFKAAYAGSANTTRYNSTDGTTVMFGGTLGIRSYLRVTEIL